VWLDAHEDEKPTLARLARVAGVSPWHLQRSFTRLYGVSPRDYAAARRVGRLKAALRAGSSSTDAVYEAGYGSPSRVYAEADRTLGMTPAAYRDGGAAERVRYAIADSEIGKVLVASTARGLCRVAMGDSAALKEELAREFPGRRSAKTPGHRLIARFVGST
jgi:AraC family transcriptional regulator of adaptative response/methylated-DNA-[protein]-cysteine methyltransferase